MGGAIIFLLGWFLGLISGIAVSLKTAMEKKYEEENERKKYEELKVKFGRK
ncbi:hypothetical protein MHI11_09645 [Bacillus sp. FSL K6-3312]|uniref:hypothetical protein n=1 Tax=Bacillus TaxID=1386 RepID=UPI0030F7CA8E